MAAERRSGDGEPLPVRAPDGQQVSFALARELAGAARI
jgi:hypothetical protein